MIGRRLLGAALGLCLLTGTSEAHAQLTFVAPIAVQDIIQTIAPNSGDTVQAVSGSTVLLVNSNGLIAVLTVNLPAPVADGQRWMIASGAAITLLNIGGGTIKGLSTGISANGYARFIYSATAGAWFRTG